MTDRAARRTLHLARPLLLLLALTPAALGQKKDEVPKNHPSTDPYTQGDPTRMVEAGIYSMGGFDFGRTDTAEIDEWMAQADIRWIETEHFEIGFALGPIKVKRADLKVIGPELDELRTVLPEVPEKPKRLDVWLRAHLFALRCEKLYARAQDLLGVTDADFPDRPLDFYSYDQKYMGMGPYLGQKSKYEVLILPSETLAKEYNIKHYGISVVDTQRWNMVDRGALTVTVTGDGYLAKSDLALYGHLAFQLAVNLLDGYKMYTYEVPIYFREGLAHVFEREVQPDFNSFDADEGSTAEVSREDDWIGEVRDLIKSEEATSLSKLTRLRSYGEMTLEDHYSAWSKVQYMAYAHPEATAKFLDRIAGLMNDQHVPDGSNLLDHHRDAVQEFFGMSYAQFDAAWAAWVQSPEAEAAQASLAERYEALAEAER
ncbi:MAG: hypothetical protein AAFZ65_18075 [Planctomycetota bacterium]